MNRSVQNLGKGVHRGMRFLFLGVVLLWGIGGGGGFPADTMGAHPEIASRRGVCGRVDVEKPADQIPNCEFKLHFYFRDNLSLAVCTNRKDLALLGYRDFNELRTLLEKDIIVIYYPPSEANPEVTESQLAKIHIAGD